jgi:hypothetical protein
MAGLLDSVLENSMSAGLQTNLKNAITDAGVKVPSSTCLWQYPEVIRKNLVSKTVTGVNILGGDVINIDTKVENDIVFTEYVCKLLKYNDNYDIISYTFKKYYKKEKKTCEISLVFWHLF